MGVRRIRPISHEDRLSVVDHLDELRSRLIVCAVAFCVAWALTAWQNHLVLEIINAPLPNDIQVFTCGPLPFMRHVRTSLIERGVPANRIRYEVFGPDLWAARIPA